MKVEELPETFDKIFQLEPGICGIQTLLKVCTRHVNVVMKSREIMRRWMASQGLEQPCATAPAALAKAGEDLRKSQYLKACWNGLMESFVGLYVM